MARLISADSAAEDPVSAKRSALRKQPESTRIYSDWPWRVLYQPVAYAGQALRRTIGIWNAVLVDKLAMMGNMLTKI